MHKIKLNLRSMVAIVICLAATTFFSGCNNTAENKQFMGAWRITDGHDNFQIMGFSSEDFSIYGLDFSEPDIVVLILSRSGIIFTSNVTFTFNANKDSIKFRRDGGKVFSAKYSFPTKVKLTLTDNEGKTILFQKHEW